MKKKLLCAISIFLFSPSVFSFDNENFAFGLVGTHPIKWKDYEPLQKNAIACDQEKSNDKGTCQEVQQKVILYAHDAYIQALLANISAPKEEQFCDESLNELVHKKEVGPMAAIALLAVNDRLKFGSGLYPDLPNTYLGKIVFDAFVAESPCTKIGP